jgi:choline dehydrogenase-like flavoprotein
MIDGAESLGPDDELHTDICIVGAGPAGIAIALQFLDAGARVVVLESGGRRPDRASQELCRGDVVNAHLHPPADTYRRRGLGGSSSVWGGRCAPFDRQDFEPRPWLSSLSGWPIDYAALVPYWRRAHAICGLGIYDYAAGSAIASGMRPMFPGFVDGPVSTACIERFSPPTDFGRFYGPALERSRRVRVLLGALCVDIILHPDLRTVRHIEAASRGGGKFRVRARNFVLAAGGLEVPRLLLAGRRQMPCGIGNGSDLVGRFYMCHLAGTVGHFVPAPGRAPWHGYDRTADGVYCRRRISISAAAQRDHGIGNVIARLHHPRPADPAHKTGALSAIHLGRRLLPYEYAVRLGGVDVARLLPHLQNVGSDPIGTASFAWHMLRHRVFAARKFPSLIVVPRAGPYRMDVHAEQLPNPSSRVTLTRDSDAFGVPMLRIDWRYLDQDIRSARTSLGLMAGALSTSGHGRLTFDPAMVEDDLLREGAYGGHHLGTARMATTATTGVVDVDCRVYGTSNLYIASGAVFPTSGQANPTLTIVALALRLADHLAARLAQPGEITVRQPALSATPAEAGG